MEQYRVIKYDGGTIDESNCSRVLADEGYFSFRWSDAPGAVYPDHHHSTDQSHWILSGRLELTVEGYGTFVLEAGDRDIMPAGTKHSARVLGNEPVVYLIGEKS
ncbi:MAG: cupin domain-containing protein [Acidobacteria bacterium]|nr:cupin domain-containing protein [Acidobacteriota bacterium]